MIPCTCHIEIILLKKGQGHFKKEAPLPLLHHYISVGGALSIISMLSEQSMAVIYGKGIHKPMAFPVLVLDLTQCA